jgi:hypothetical protein
MTLLDKLNPEQVTTLLLKKDERPMHYERAMVALTNNNNVFELLKMTNYEILRKPIQPNEIEWRVQSAKGGKTTIVPYIQSRAVMNRLDEAFGPEGWTDSYREWKGKGVMCTLSVKTEEGWISKEDGADDTAIESTKGGISDALKRAAVKWGMGRDLYEYPLVQIEGEMRFVPREIRGRLDQMTSMINDGQFTQQYVLIKKQ